MPYPPDECCLPASYLGSNLQVVMRWAWDVVQELIVLTSVLGDCCKGGSLGNTALLYAFFPGFLFWQNIHTA